MTANLILRFDGAIRYAGPERLFPYAAGSGRPPIFFLLSFSASVPAAIRTGVLRPRLLEQALHPPSCALSFCPFFFQHWHPLRVVGTLIKLFLAGHIIASETEEDIFQILGGSDHDI
jgi:hypothetical protein